MSHIWDVNLIRFFDFYLTAMFLLSTAVRIRQYHAILALVRSLGSRWPRLFQLVKQHRSIFLTWETIAPGALALFLWALQMFASRLLWPDAVLTPRHLSEHLLALPAIGLLGLGMVAVDVYFIIDVGAVNRPELERYLDQAEYWLKSWAAPVVRTLTFGFVNPRKMVAVEVQTSLVSASKMLNATLWWVVLQAALRVGFGVAMWLAFALT